MHLACQEGLQRTAKFILQQECVPITEILQFKTASSWTPLMTAAEAGQTEMMDIIVNAAENKLDVLGYTCESGSPLHAAITGQNPLETVQHLVDLIESAAIDEGDPDLADTVINKKDQSEVHPLFLAVYSGNLEVTKFLLDSGAKTALASDAHGATLLHICAERGYSELTKVVCEADPQLVFESDEDGNTALHIVCDWDYTDVLKTLCDTMDA